MKLQNKIKWRAKYLFELSRVLLKEPRRDSLLFLLAHLLPRDSFLRDKVHQKYIKSFICGSLSSEELVLDLKLFKVVADKAHCYKNKAITLQFFDLVYPYLAKNPILIREEPYEKDGVELKTGDIAVDAGAYLGLFSLLASKKVGPMGKVYAFEPISENYKLLKKSVKLNKAENIEVIPRALAEKEGMLSMVAEEGRFNQSSGFLKDGRAKRTVKQISLDEFIKQKKISRIDFIKVDTEGMEREVLTGAKRVIRKFKPRLAICTYHRPDDSKIIKEIIQSSGQQYKFTQTEKKLYAW